MTGSAAVPVLMRPGEVMSIKRAADYARKSDKTIRRWIAVYGIARQASERSPLEISLPALEMVMHGDIAALDLLRAGKRSAPEVRRYLDFLGIPD